MSPTTREPRAESTERLRHSIARRLDAIALDQLRAECARLATERDQLRDENDQLRTELQLANDDADSWRDDALRMQEDLAARTGGTPGITITGALVVVPASESAA